MPLLPNAVEWLPAGFLKWTTDSFSGRVLVGSGAEVDVVGLLFGQIRGQA